MARIDRSGEAFLRALDEAGRSLLAAAEDDPPPPRPNAPPASVHFGSGQGGGGEARWSFAMQWTDGSVPLLARPASDPAREPEASRSETKSAIARRARSRGRPEPGADGRSLARLPLAQSPGPAAGARPRPRRRASRDRQRALRRGAARAGEEAMRNGRPKPVKKPIPREAPVGGLAGLRALDARLREFVL